MSRIEPTPSMGGREWLLMIVLSAVWGSSFLFFKILVAQLQPFTIVLGRVGIAAIVLNLILALRGTPLRLAPAMWASFLVLGLLNNVIPFALIAYGEARIPSGSAAILNATTPIFTMLVAHIFTHNEKLTWNKSAGVVLGFVGVTVLIGPAALGGMSRTSLVGDAASLLAAITYGFGGVFSRRFRSFPPMMVATAQLTASVALVLPLALVFDRPAELMSISLHGWAALLGLAVPSTALAYLMFFRIMAVAGATNAILVTLLVPVSSLILGALFLGEPITSLAVAGMALIGAGLAAIDGRPLAMLRRV